MKVVQEYPSHYVIGLPDGRTLAVAKTPGTMQMLADGGVVEGDPAASDEEVKAWMATTPSLAGFDYDSMPQPMKDQFKRDLAGRGDMLRNVRDQSLPPEPLPVAKGTAVAPPAGMGGDQPTAPALEARPMITNAAGAPSVTRAPVAGPPESAAGIVPQGTMQQEYQAATQQLTPQQQDAARGEMLRSLDLGDQSNPWGSAAVKAMEDVNRSTEVEAEHAASGQRQVAAHLLGQERAMAALGPAPTGQNIDPTQMYARIGAGLGAKSPTGQRLVGGIAMGLMSGLGEVGAALSHRENGAAKIIAQAIQDNIAEQQGANALTRQQWMDQTNYQAALAQKKMEELAAISGSTEVQDQAKILADKMRAALFMAMAQKAVMPPETAEQLGIVAEANAAMKKYAILQDRIASTAAGTAEQAAQLYLTGKGPLPPNVPVLEAEEARKSAIMKLALAQNPRARTITPEMLQRSEEMIGTMLLNPQTRRTKIVNIGGMLRSQYNILSQTAHGRAPDGATIPQPPEEDDGG